MITEARKTRGIIRQGTRANQPAATDVLWGTLYYVTDEGIIERSDGVSWWGFSSNINLPIAQSDVTGLVADLASKLESPVNLTTQVSGVLPAAHFPVWNLVAYDAANFSAKDSMIWTVGSGDIAVNRYLILGKLVIWAFGVHSTDISGTASNTLYATIPGSLLPSQEANISAGYGSDAGGAVIPIFFTLRASQSVMEIRKTSLANWSLGFDMSVLGTIFFEIA